MNRTEAANEDLSNLLDGPFVDDWTLTLDLDDSLHTGCLNFPPITNVDFPTMQPPDSTTDSHGLLTMNRNHSSQNLLLDPSVFDLFPQMLPERGPLPHDYAMDNGLESVPEKDPLSENHHHPTLSMDCGYPQALEIEEQYHHPASLFPCHQSVLSSVSSHPSILPYCMDSESLKGVHSRNDGSDSNSSHESYYQPSECFFHSQESGLLNNSSSTIVAPLPSSIQPSPSVFQSTVISPAFQNKMLQPSLLDPYQKEIKMEPGQNPIHGTNINLNSELTTMLMNPHQSVPQMKLPSLPQRCGPQESVYVTTGDPLLQQNTNSGTNSLFQSKPFDQLSVNVESTGSTGMSFKDVQTTQSTSNLSCISTNTSVESILTGGGRKLDSFTNKCFKRNTVSKITPEERRLKILRYRQKRINRRFNRGVTYQCRKTLADSRPRVRGRFAKNDDIHALLPTRHHNKHT